MRTPISAVGTVALALGALAQIDMSCQGRTGIPQPSDRQWQESQR
jgi:hypothetical protein